MEPQLAALRQAQLHDLMCLGWRPADPSSPESIALCFEQVFKDTSEVAQNNGDPGRPQALAGQVWSGIALLAYGQLWPLEEVLRVIESNPSVVRSREAGSIIRAIKLLVPFPESMSPAQEPRAAQEWLAANGDRLKWDEAAGKFGLTA